MTPSPESTKVYRIRIVPLRHAGIPAGKRADAGAPVGRDRAIAGGAGALVETGHLARDDRHGAEELEHPRAQACALDDVELALEHVRDRLHVLSSRVLGQVEPVATIVLKGTRRGLRLVAAIRRIDLNHLGARARKMREHRKHDDHRTQHHPSHVTIPSQ